MKEIHAAILAVQSKLKPFIKDKLNPYYNSKFVDLSTILETVLPALHEQELILTQPTAIQDGRFGVRTVLTHSSGQTAESFYVLDVEEKAPQKLAAALTFARRYALVSFLALSCDLDDDGQTAAPAKKEAPQAESKTKKTSGADGVEFSTFIPAAYSTKDVSKEKDGTLINHSVKDPSGTWYSTLDEANGYKLKDAKDNEAEVRIGWKINGKYKNIVSVDETQEVAF